MIYSKYDRKSNSSDYATFKLRHCCVLRKSIWPHLEQGGEKWEGMYLNVCNREDCRSEGEWRVEEVGGGDEWKRYGVCGGWRR